MSMSSTAVMLASYNGERYIAEQIESLVDQTGASVEIWLSDDNSCDASVEIVKSAAKERLQAVLRGPQEGFSANFRHLVLNCGDGYKSYAFCDQDDVWLAEKLKVATQWLEAQRTDKPALWCGRTRIIDENAVPIDYSPAFRRTPTFRNALVQSIAGGNTMVMNAAAFQLIRESYRNGVPPSHDWWSYIMVSGAGGAVRYDLEPYVLYRDHPGNLVGPNSTFRARMSRVRMAMGGRFRQWNDCHFMLLDRCIELMEHEAQEIYAEFRAIRNRSISTRMSALRNAGVYRQTLMGNMMMHASCAAGRF